jgi:hypothetical protein
MKHWWVAAGLVVAFSGCSTTTGPVTAWGKPGVTKPEFGNDIGMCTGLAAQQSSGSGTNTAGGVSGRNNSSSAGSATAGASSGTVAGGTYQGMASGDFAQRAATQQRAQEMAAKRMQADAYRNCLAQRGYKEFTLTPEQRAKLGSFKAGTEEYYEYLYTLGSDPKVVSGSK